MGENNNLCSICFHGHARGKLGQNMNRRDDKYVTLDDVLHLIPIAEVLGTGGEDGGPTMSELLLGLTL